MPLLSVENISKSFPHADATLFRVLQDVSFQLQAGEIVCLLGPSGSGKTTLLQILAGMETPDSGSVKTRIKCPGPRLGYMTQADQLLSWRTIEDNISLGAELLGNHAGNNALLTQVGLDGFGSHYPAQISGGMNQRALLARTLATRPELLLLDEPMSNLDVLARRQMAGILKEYVRNTQAAALVVTHSVEEAAFLADRVILITRSPATIYQEISGNFTLDNIMQALLGTLEGGRT